MHLQGSAQGGQQKNQQRMKSHHPHVSLANRLRESLERNHSRESYDEADRAVLGQCQEMCPAKERQDREIQRRLHHLEVVAGTAGTRKPKADPQLAIKEYSRPAAGKQEATISDLRPPDVLLKTVNHIVNNILPRTDIEWSTLYNFAFDRLRAVRQDLVIQRACGHECATILEQCVRFYIYAAYRLCSASLSEFDPKINSDHTSECLKRLLFLYKLQDENGCANGQSLRAEMEACNVLFNLGSIDSLLHTCSLPKSVRSSPRLKNAVALSLAHLDGNFIRVKRLTCKLNAIEMCCLHAHLPQIQRLVLLTMTSAYSSKNLSFPTQKLSMWLMCDNKQQAEQLCRHYGLSVSDGRVQFKKGDFNEEQKLPQKRPWATYVECQLEVTSIPEIIQGTRIR